MPTKEISYIDAVKDTVIEHDALTFKPRIVAMIPAHDEEGSVGKVLKSLKEQNLPNGLVLDVFIALDDCKDEGTKNEVIETNKELGLNIYYLETIDNNTKKVGALNQLYQLFYGNLDHLNHKKVGNQQIAYKNSIQAFLGIDADIYMAKDCLSTLWNELLSQYNIGSVSANYTCLLPESHRKVLRNDPEREAKLEKGGYGNWINRWWVVQQMRDFADWTLKQKFNKHVAEIAGGQCSLFRASALENVKDHYKLNGIYDSQTATEDLLLTQHIRALGWRPVISHKARCYVDAMNTRHTYISQRKKWVSGTIQFMTDNYLSTRYSRRLWLQEAGLGINFIIRILFLVLVTTSVLMGQFTWRWIWVTPYLLGALLNTILTLKTPNFRWVDVIMALLGLSPEIYLWITLYVHAKIWIGKFSVVEEDSSVFWHEQYSAESGVKKKTNIVPYLISIIVLMGVGFYFREAIMSLSEFSSVVMPYVLSGFKLLTFLTVLTSLVVVNKIFRLRAPYKA